MTDKTIGAAVEDAGERQAVVSHLMEMAARVGDAHENHGRNADQTVAARIKFHAAICAALAASATPGSGEPVARAFVDGNDVCRELRWMPDLPSFDLPVGTKLYAHPPTASAGDALTQGSAK